MIVNAHNIDGLTRRHGQECAEVNSEEGVTKVETRRAVRCAIMHMPAGLGRRRGGAGEAAFFLHIYFFVSVGVAVVLCPCRSPCSGAQVHCKMKINLTSAPCDLLCEGLRSQPE